MRPSAPPARRRPGTTKAPVEVTLYPILVVAPIFGASIDLPSLRRGRERRRRRERAQSASTDAP